ncbi:MAG: ComF family protein [Actinobacteria bacterium]|nr:MAG: ComF family protein [Actinomycetota bacterium]
MRLLDLLLPVRCVVCAAGGEELCGPCRERLPLLRPPLCARCGAPTAWPVRRCRECSGRRLALASARAAVEYDDCVRRLVAGWKERGLRRLAGEAADLVVAGVERPGVAALTFVPPDRARVLIRGHHPAERLAHELGGRWELPVAPLLARTRQIRHQRGLTRADRRRNVAGAFRPAVKPPTRIGLVDDVYTSGATANAAASALRTGGARHVEVVTFARVVR